MPLLVLVTPALGDTSMKKIIPFESKGRTQGASSDISERLPSPKGIGMAVAFDWGLTVELLVGPLLLLFFGPSNGYKQLHLNTTTITLLSILILWPIAIIFAVLGEGLRSGWTWVRRLQIVGNVLGFVGGFFLLGNVWQGIKAGNYWPIIPATILLIFSPLIAWRLSRPATAKWFKTVTTSEARKRHGGLWPWLILIWSIVGGGLVAWGAFVK